MFKPSYTINPKMISLLSDIAESKAIIERARLLPKQEIHLRRQALIRMTQASTAIEGNVLESYQVEALLGHKKVDAPTRDIYEVENYLAAMKYIGQVVTKKQKITEKIILKIHGLVTQKTLPEAQSGHYRKGPIYIVKKQWGMPQQTVYTGPAADKVPSLMKNLVQWLETTAKEELNPVIISAIVHQEIAAIHPFNDGNGRTARAVATLLLYQRGYDFKRLFALEDYYNKDREKYYDAINIGKNYEERRADFTPWLLYFIKGFKLEIDEVKKTVLSLAGKKISLDTESQIYLDKEQLQIIDFLDQVGKITVQDVIDILKCPKRTAQYQLQRLKKLKMIEQVGKGPAAGYVLSK